MPAASPQDRYGASATLTLLLALGVSLGIALAYDRQHTRDTPVQSCIERGMAAYDDIGSDPTVEDTDGNDATEAARLVESRCRRSTHAY